MSSAFCFNLDQSNILSSGNGLSSFVTFVFRSKACFNKLHTHKICTAQWDPDLHFFLQHFSKPQGCKTTPFQKQLKWKKGWKGGKVPQQNYEYLCTKSLKLLWLKTSKSRD